MAMNAMISHAVFVRGNRTIKTHQGPFLQTPQKVLLNRFPNGLGGKAIEDEVSALWPHSSKMEFPALWLHSSKIEFPALQLHSSKMEFPTLWPYSNILATCRYVAKYGNKEPTTLDVHV